MKLSKDKEHLVLENRKLVYYVIRGLQIPPNSSDFDDISSIGTIGLIKAAITFQPEKKLKFTTYAIPCIRNEILMHYRKVNRMPITTSLQQCIESEDSLDERCFEDILADEKTDFIEDMKLFENLEEVMRLVLNYLQGLLRIVFLYYLGGFNQREIAEILNISQSSISRIRTEALLTLKLALENKPKYKEVFSMNIKKEEYNISFLSKDIKRFNQIFALLLQDINAISNLPYFRVDCTKERIVIHLPADNSSFAFLARLMQEIEDFSIKYVSNKSELDDEMKSKQEKNIVSTSTEQSRKEGDFHSDKVTEKNITETIAEPSTKFDAMRLSENVLEVPCKPGEKPLYKDCIDSSNMKVSEQSVNGKSDDNSKKLKRRANSNMAKVRDYVLNQDVVYVKELKSIFKDLPSASVSNAVHHLNKKGLITSIGHGKYKVNK